MGISYFRGFAALNTWSSVPTPGCCTLSSAWGTLKVLEDLGLRYVEYPYKLFKSGKPEDAEARVAEVAGVAENVT